MQETVLKECNESEKGNRREQKGGEKKEKARQAPTQKSRKNSRKAGKGEK